MCNVYGVSCPGEEEEEEEEGQGSDAFVDSGMEEEYWQMRLFHLDLIYDLPLFVFIVAIDILASM